MKKKERVIHGVCLDSYMRILDKDFVIYLSHHSPCENYNFLCYILDIVRCQNKKNNK